MVIYTGHGRYGSGPDFDPINSAKGNFVIGKPYEAGHVALNKGQTDLQKTAMTTDYQLMLFDGCTTATTIWTTCAALPARTARTSTSLYRPARCLEYRNHRRAEDAGRCHQGQSINQIKVQTRGHQQGAGSKSSCGRSTASMTTEIQVTARTTHEVRVGLADINWKVKHMEISTASTTTDIIASIHSALACALVRAPGHGLSWRQQGQSNGHVERSAAPRAPSASRPPRLSADSQGPQSHRHPRQAARYAGRGYLCSGRARCAPLTPFRCWSWRRWRTAAPPRRRSAGLQGTADTKGEEFDSASVPRP